MVRLLCILTLAGCFPLAGCQPLMMSMAGAGATAAFGQSLSGVTYRTFTAPLPAVKKASIAALRKMGISLDSFGRFDHGEIIYARTAEWTVEIELERISQRATRVRVATRNGSFFYDSATAKEIVQQTEKML